ncbi:MAG: hypothetical protein LBJ48_04925 [Coriobacteriales bacterium]|jgi:hypothetical protein|nr:hypothetical protein [Coriobacteriales bacterium]
MYETIMNKHAYNQLGFYVKDLEQSCREHSALFGSGPFYYMEPSTQTAVYRGREIELTLQVAFAHYGNLQIEMETVLSPDDPFAELGH